MIIDTGTARKLRITGVIDGTASEHDGQLYFLTDAKPALLKVARAGLMDGERVQLRLVKAPDKLDPFCIMAIVA